ncbi:MAG: hypothetical protein HW402_979 [Dehalococcoidales bacterium]|nr:hypothetical protein [Dehalococcoidales bacterium]
MERLPLNGIRVLACDFYWAGPYNTFMLANLGAQVIKVEHHLARGPLVRRHELPTRRSYPDGEPGEAPWNRSGYINQFGLNKLSVVLDLNHPKGKDIFLKLVKISDVVQDNYSTRAMINFGLDYPALKAANPKIIMIRQPGFGTIGPYKDYVAGGCPTEVHGGLTYYMGYHGEGPMRAGTCLVDPWAGLHACCSVLAALWQRRRTGKGQFIDSSQTESTTMLVGDRVLGYQMGSNWPDRFGNRHPSQAPHGCYPCKGKDKWIAIAVASDEEWANLCCVMGNPSWTKEERFSDQFSRSKHQDEMDGLISQWTSQHEHIALMQILQSQGVAAGAVLDQSELMNDPHSKERNYYVDIEHPDTGVRAHPATTWKMSKTQRREWTRAPLLGEHNKYVFGELLGLSDAEIAQLQEEKVISDRPLA